MFGAAALILPRLSLPKEWQSIFNSHDTSKTQTSKVKSISLSVIIFLPNQAEVT